MKIKFKVNGGDTVRTELTKIVVNTTLHYKKS